MSSSTSADAADISLAAAFAALSVEFVVHPFDTLITRIQSPEYVPKYQSHEGKLQPALFRGLYRGLTPTVVTTIPASVTFFTIYETAKSALQPKEGLKPGSLSQTAVHAASSALADMLACLIINPSEVLKQNAQVARFSEGGVERNPMLASLKHFARHPLKLWTGYTVLVAGNLPRTSLTFSIYEYLKGAWLRRSTRSDSIMEQVKVSGITAGIGGSIASLLFVPIDVVKTRMRLPEKAPPSHPLQPEALFTSSLSREKVRKPAARGPISIANGILVRDGISGLFRGATVTCIAAAVGNGLFLGCYEGLKLYYASEALKHELIQL
ncbi:PET8 member of the mitochondrial carrier (MCF) family [Fusarium beomiforme]|uniref:PET8 member of the mitochondrial carrier (MCF) family n=1 Tax=Fusarium beomiforme TaxID=44412 RepID=A0A9P5DPD6_9HYPO|nr:PET8 member of the mitochondrial carrier (MCF) family [Fusarium beomiforme]